MNQSTGTDQRRSVLSFTSKDVGELRNIRVHLHDVASDTVRMVMSDLSGEGGAVSSKPRARSTLRTSLSDLTRILGPWSWARDCGLTFNVGRTAELLRNRFGTEQDFDSISNLRLDVVIPAADKDSEVLPLTVSGIRRNLAHPLGKIVVVAALGSRVGEVAAKLDCEVIDEDAILPLRKADLHYQVEGVDRSGWLFQQLIKLSADTLSTEDHVLLLDADTVMIRPQTLTRQGDVVALYSHGYHLPYFSVCAELLPTTKQSRLSFIAHHMIVSRRSLADLKAGVELRRQVPWWQAVIDASDFTEGSCFASDELYGNYELSLNNAMLRRWWANLPLSRNSMSTLDELNRRYGSTYRTVSFHSYIRKRA